MHVAALPPGVLTRLPEIFRDPLWISKYGGRFDRDQKTIYDGNYKWIWHSDDRHELYNVLHDPDETNNLYGRFPDMEQRFQEQLLPLIEDAKEFSALSPAEIDHELRNRLKALGYIQ